MQKFFCDNCGTQVKKNEIRCPKCGRYFKSVRCPKCGLTGKPDLFTNGCPSCGYAEENFQEGNDYFDLADGKKSGLNTGRRNVPSQKSQFSDRFYKKVLPVLITLFIVLIILLFRSSL